jgi:hypothetical protein
MTVASLQADYDQSISTGIITLSGLGATTYCVQATSPNDTDKIAVKNGPSQQIVIGTVSSGSPTAC